MMLLQYSRRKKRKEEAADAIFPSEIFFEILSCLSVETLLRMKCVCKEWYAMIEEPCFIEEHMRKGRIFTIAYSDNVKRTAIEEVVYGSIKHMFLTLCGCRGLVLQLSLLSAKYRVTNRATRRTLDLPDPHKKSFGMEFTYAKTTGEYKIVSVYVEPNEPTGEGCEVLRIGDDGDLRWKQVRMPALLKSDSKRKRSMMLPAENTVHFVKLVSNIVSYYIQVDSFDLITDTFTSTTLPTGFFSDLRKVRVFNARGLLAFAAIDVEHSELHILSLNGHRQSKWAKWLLVYPLNCLDSQDIEKIVPVCILKECFWLLVGGEKIIAYNIDSEKITHTEVAPEGKKISGLVYYSPSSLVFLKGMRQDTQNNDGQR